MLKKIRRLRQSLSVKLVIVILLMVVPINILIFLLSDSMIKNFQVRLVDAYSNELKLYIADIDTKLDEISTSAEGILSANWTILNGGVNNQSREIEIYDFMLELRNARTNSDLVRMAYLKINADNNVRVTYDADVFSLEQVQSIQSYIGRTDSITGGQRSFSLITIDGRQYLIKNYTISSVSFGFIIDAQFLLDSLSGMRIYDTEKFRIADRSGIFLSPADGNISASQNGMIQITKIEDSTPRMLVIARDFRGMDYTAVRLIPEAEVLSAVPFLERSLQIIGFLSLLIVPILWLLVRHLVLKPLRKLDLAMRQIEADNLEFQMAVEQSSYEFRHISKTFNRMMSDIKSLTIESYEKDIEKLQIEAANIRLQVNPHMLLNSLNMIYSLSQSRNFEYIQDFTLHLVNYFRYALRRTDDMVTLEEELWFVKNYLEVQKIRFPDTFNCVIDVRSEFLSEQIPALLIQGFVENSVKYGITPGGITEITVKIDNEGDKLVILISDNGNGIEESQLEIIRSGKPIDDAAGKHIGIWNCRRRLNMIYGDRAVLDITSVNREGTQVRIELPIL